MSSTRGLHAGFVAALILTGCSAHANRMGATQYPPRPQPARMLWKEQLDHYDLDTFDMIGRVDKRTALCGITPAKLDAGNHEALAREAADIGGDVVVIRCGEIDTWEACTCHGDVLRYREGHGDDSLTGSRPAAPIASGCVKDTDCKGDRICENGRCVSPH